MANVIIIGRGIATALSPYEDIRKERTAMAMRKVQENRAMAFESPG